MKRRLKKNDKLRFKQEFDFVREHGRKWVASGMLLVHAVSEDDSIKCGVICSKKYSLLAVKRNRARRLLWESFRLLRPELTGPCRLVLIPRGKMKSKVYRRQTVTREMAGLLVKAGLLPETALGSLPEC